MAFFDKVKEVGAKGLDKAKDLGDQAKLNVQKEKAGIKVKDIYTEVGQALVEKFPEFFAENFAEQAEGLKGLQEEIAKLEEQLAAYKDKGEKVVEAVKAEEEKAE